METRQGNGSKNESDWKGRLMKMMTPSMLLMKETKKKKKKLF